MQRKRRTDFGKPREKKRGPYFPPVVTVSRVPPSRPRPTKNDSMTCNEQTENTISGEKNVVDASKNKMEMVNKNCITGITLKNGHNSMIYLSQDYFRTATPIQPILQILTAVHVEYPHIRIRLLLTDGEKSCDRFGFCKTLDDRVIVDRLESSANMSVIKLLSYHFVRLPDDVDTLRRKKFVIIKDYKLLSNPKTNLKAEMERMKDPSTFFELLTKEMYRNNWEP